MRNSVLYGHVGLFLWLPTCSLPQLHFRKTRGSIFILGPHCLPPRVWSVCATTVIATLKVVINAGNMLVWCPFLVLTRHFKPLPTYASTTDDRRQTAHRSKEFRPMEIDMQIC